MQNLAPEMKCHVKWSGTFECSLWATALEILHKLEAFFWWMKIKTNKIKRLPLPNKSVYLSQGVCNLEIKNDWAVLSCTDLRLPWFTWSEKSSRCTHVMWFNAWKMRSETLHQELLTERAIFVPQNWRCHRSVRSRVYLSVSQRAETDQNFDQSAIF